MKPTTIEEAYAMYRALNERHKAILAEYQELDNHIKELVTKPATPLEATDSTYLAGLMQQSAKGYVKKWSPNS